MERLRRLQQTVLQQRDLIAEHNDYLLNEQRVAKAVFDRVAHSGCLDAPNIRFLQSPYSLFNGDLLLAAYTPSGDTHLLLADFTGHGLPAAIGAMPLAEVFYSMTAKGYGLAEILREMNAKLKRILPVDMFCCATLLCVSAQRRCVEVWNGGMPDGYLQSGGERTALTSQHLPLGVLRAEVFDHATQVFAMLPGDQVFLLTDGVIDTCGPDQQLFGVERLERVLDANRHPLQLIAEVEQALRDFQGRARDGDHGRAAHLGDPRRGGPGQGWHRFGRQQRGRAHRRAHRRGLHRDHRGLDPRSPRLSPGSVGVCCIPRGRWCGVIPGHPQSDARADPLR